MKLWTIETKIRKGTSVSTRWAIVLIGVLAGALLVPRQSQHTVEAQSGDTRKRFTRSPVTDKSISRGKPRQQQITVVLKLAGDPVAIVRSRQSTREPRSRLDHTATRRCQSRSTRTSGSRHPRAG